MQSGSGKQGRAARTTLLRHQADKKENERHKERKAMKCYSRERIPLMERMETIFRKTARNVISASLRPVLSLHSHFFLSLFLIPPLSTF